MSISNTLKLRSVNSDTGGSDNTTSSDGDWSFEMQKGTYDTWLLGGGTRTTVTSGSRGSRDIDSSSNTNYLMQRVTAYAHTHNMYLRGSVDLGNGDTETRPNNFTQIIWKRIS